MIKITAVVVRSEAADVEVGDRAGVSEETQWRVEGVECVPGTQEQGQCPLASHSIH